MTAARYLGLAVAIWTATASSAQDAPKLEKPAVAIVPTRSPGNAFGDEVGEFEFRIEARRACKGRIVWRIAAGTATVKAGEVAFDAAANLPKPIAIKVNLPPIKDGVILATRLTLAAIEEDQIKPVATFEQNLWLFPKDPFADRVEWLKKLQITLYDPKGDTAKVLSEAKVPFEEARDLDALLATNAGLILVGEGLAFKDEKGLSATLHKLATAGRTVLILAPASGELAIPGIGGPIAGLRDLSFRSEIVRTLDERLDPDGWLPDGQAIASTVVVKMGEDSLGGEVAKGPGGWPWVEARATAGKGRWALCGLGIIAKWNAGPTPRFLFARMLEYLTEPEQPKKENER